MPEIPPNQKCPSKEELSAYFDNELSQREHVEQHLKTCKDCRDYIDSLAKMDASIKDIVNRDTGNDDDISARIKERVSESLKDEENMSKWKLFRPVIWRAAVLLLIGCGIGYLLWEESQKNNRTESEKGIQNSAQTPASFSSSPGNSAAVENGAAANVVSLKHTWKVPAKNEKELESFIKKQNISASSFKKTEKGWVLTCEFSKNGYEQFVKNCNDSGYQLIPSANLSSVIDEKGKVRYTAEFIK